jgi:hypothetical protein
MGNLKSLYDFKEGIARVAGRRVEQIADDASLASAGIDSCLSFRKLAKRLTFPIDDYVSDTGILTQTGRCSFERMINSLERGFAARRASNDTESSQYFSNACRVFKDSLENPQEIFNLTVLQAYTFYTLECAKNR